MPDKAAIQRALLGSFLKGAISGITIITKVIVMLGNLRAGANNGFNSCVPFLVRQAC